MQKRQSPGRPERPLPRLVDQELAGEGRHRLDDAVARLPSDEHAPTRLVERRADGRAAAELGGRAVREGGPVRLKCVDDRQPGWEFHGLWAFLGPVLGSLFGAELCSITKLNFSGQKSY